MNKFIKWLTLFVYGGSIYFFIEVIYKSLYNEPEKIHWSMWILGGLCFYVSGIINEFILTEKMPLWLQCLIATVGILIMELIVGLIVNRWLQWNVWRYDKYHILNQICLPFGIAWYFLSAVAIWLDDKLRELIFKEKRMTYKIF